MNRIVKLKNESREWLDWKNGLQGLIQSFYTDVFTTRQVVFDDVVDCVPQSILYDQNGELNKEVTMEEVKFALF